MTQPLSFSAPAKGFFSIFPPSVFYTTIEAIITPTTALFLHKVNFSLSSLLSTTPPASPFHPTQHTFTPIIMPNNSNVSIPGHYALACTFSNLTEVSNSDNNDRTIPQNPFPFSSLLQVLFSPATVDPLPPPLTCPISNCSLVFTGRTPQRYLSRHLKHPGIHGRTGGEKAAWLSLHKIEHERLTAAHGTFPFYIAPSDHQL